MKLITWGRQVKSRRSRSAPSRWRKLPVLWLFSDPARLPDPRAAAARLPAGLCGVVLRYDGPARSATARACRLAAGRALASVCRSRRLVLQVAGDAWLAQALGAGVHLRRGYGRRVRHRGLVTSSAHDGVELRRARLAGAAAVFLSPCFPTVSHPGARLLQARGWGGRARQAGVAVLALGGVTGRLARALPRDACAGAGAIDGLALEAIGGEGKMAVQRAPPLYEGCCLRERSAC